MVLVYASQKYAAEITWSPAGSTSGQVMTTLTAANEPNTAARRRAG
jgi:hypothetical protein